MSDHTVEMEVEVFDWLEQLPVVSFATAAFFVGLLSRHGALLPPPHSVQLGGKLSRLRELQFFLGLEQTGVTYRFGPKQRVVLLTVFREPHIRHRHEVDRAKAAVLRCTAHDKGDHLLWRDLRDERMVTRPAEEAYEAARRSYEFGCTVRSLRLGRRASVRTLAQAAGTTESVISRCETGGVSPSTPVATRIVEALGREAFMAASRRWLS